MGRGLRWRIQAKKQMSHRVRQKVGIAQHLYCRALRLCMRSRGNGEYDHRQEASGILTALGVGFLLGGLEF